MKQLLKLAVLGALVALSGCKDTPTGPKPGSLTVSLTVPGSDDRAIVITVSGPEAIGAVESANPAYVVHSRVTGNTARIAVFGNLASGPAVRVAVPDLRKALEYTVALGDVAAWTNLVRDPTTGYSATIAE
jgi:hypothetical protein